MEQIPKLRYDINRGTDWHESERDEAMARFAGIPMTVDKLGPRSFTAAIGHDIRLAVVTPLDDEPVHIVLEHDCAGYMGVLDSLAEIIGRSVQ